MLKHIHLRGNYNRRRLQLLIRLQRARFPPPAPMDLFSHLLAISGFLASISLYYLWRSASAHSHESYGNSPPELPGAWPIIGHLHLLGGKRPLARTLAAMADQHGPIFGFRLGVHRVVVVSNWEAIKECFTTNDRALAARPQSHSTKYLSYDSAAFGFAPLGPYWREMRKLAVIELLSARRLEMLKHVRLSELSTSIKELYLLTESRSHTTQDPTSIERTSMKSRESNKVVVISEWIGQLTLNIIVRMIAGKRYFGNGAKDAESRRFRRVIKEFMYVSGGFALSDIISFPVLRLIDSFGRVRYIKSIMKELDSIVESWIQEHVQRRLKAEPGDEGNDDFIDVMFSVIDDSFTRYHSRETIIKATILNLILAGSDTTSINLTWLLSLLLNNRHALKCAQEEIDTEIGKDRWVEESDIKDLVYLQAVAKETLRLYPPGPLSVPHLATEDCQVEGYDIPKGTRLFVNVWKMHRDPRIWSEPEKFMPERFLTSHTEVDYSGQHFEFIPFGSGRRACPGIMFAMQVSLLTLARLLQGFEFTTPSGEPVDMSEGLGITLPKATPLEVEVTPRLSPGLYEH